MLNLHQRIIEIMKTMGAVGKGGQTTYGEGFAYHKIDDVDEKLRGALCLHGVVALVTKIKDRHLGSSLEPDRYGNQKTVWHAECFVTIEFINADDPKDKLSIVGWGQGLDYSDKATGKAQSYAMKAAYLSAFHLRGQPDNESDNIVRSASISSSIGNALPAVITPEAKPWIDNINGVTSIEEFDGIYAALVNEGQEIVEACAPHYRAKRVQLWVDEIKKASSLDELQRISARLSTEDKSVKDVVRSYGRDRQKELRQ